MQFPFCRRDKSHTINRTKSKITVADSELIGLTEIRIACYSSNEYPRLMDIALFLLFKKKIFLILDDTSVIFLIIIECSYIFYKHIISKKNKL